MKDSNTMNGGNLLDSYIPARASFEPFLDSLLMVLIVATYLFKSVQGFASKGFTPYGISIQVDWSSCYLPFISVSQGSTE